MASVTHRDISGRGTLFTGPTQYDILENIIEWFSDKHRQGDSIVLQSIIWGHEEELDVTATVWYE